MKIYDIMNSNQELKIWKTNTLEIDNLKSVKVLILIVLLKLYKIYELKILLK